MSLLPSGAIESAGYDINNSLRFRRSATAYLNRTPSSAGNRKTFTYSAWIKRGLSGNNNFFNVNPNTGYSGFSLNFDLNVSGDIGVYQNTSGTDTLVVSTNALFRDFSAWYHVVVAIDTTQATAANRVLIYVNGVSQALTISTQVALNTDLYVNSTIPHFIGREQTASGGAVNYFDGYMAEVNFIDGQALTASSFGETDAVTGVWKAKKFTGTYGTNGFYLKFSDIATTSGSNAGLGKDFSGNTNYWTTNNISVTSGTTYDAMKDSPTNTSATVANYCVWNPLDNYNSLTISNGNLTAARATTASWASSRATFSMPSGKWYWEVTSGGGTTQVGILRTDTALTADSAANAYGYIYNANDGYRYNDGNSYAYGSAYNTSGDVVGVAFDADTGTLTFYKNGTSQGTAWSGLSGTYSPVISIYGTITTHANFGQRPFSYTPPTGYKALNTYNLPDSTIKKGNKYMDATTYTGTGSTQSITNAGSFKPDLVWTKSRSNAYNNVLCDSVRGVAKGIFSDLTNAEDTASPTSYVQAFNSNGFSVNIGTNSNANGATYVGWQWQAGQGSTSSNTSGSITSTVSVNTTAGFSVVTWSGNSTVGATIGHGLGVAPKLVIMKRRNGATNWPVWVTGFNSTTFLFLQSTNAVATAENYFNSTLPSSTLITLSANSEVNTTGGTYVAYCWAEIAGFSRFGSYTGNGSTDGVFVFTGFRPKYLMVKSSSAVGNWVIVDTSRNTYNVTNLSVEANNSDAEQTGTSSTMPTMDLLSNGFKLRTTSAGGNGSGVTYIYMAFAESPFKNSLAR